MQPTATHKTTQQRKRGECPSARCRKLLTRLAGMTCAHRLEYEFSLQDTSVPCHKFVTSFA